MNTITLNQKNFINTLLNEATQEAKNKAEFLTSKGINTLTKQEGSYLINILKKYSKPQNKNSKTSARKQKTQHEPIKTGTKEYEGHKSTPHSWQGVNYSRDLTTKDIAKIIRQELKYLYPQNKYSIRTEYNHIYVSLMESNKTPFENENNINWDIVSHRYRIDYGYTIEEVKEMYFQNYIDKGHMGVNNYYISDDWRMTPEGREMFQKVADLLTSFNFNDSDSMTDYFHSNFYVTLSIGKWDKPFIIKK